MVFSLGQNGNLDPEGRSSMRFDLVLSNVKEDAFRCVDLLVLMVSDADKPVLRACFTLRKCFLMFGIDLVVILLPKNMPTLSFYHGEVR